MKHQWRAIYNQTQYPAYQDIYSEKGGFSCWLWINPRFEDGSLARLKRIEFRVLSETNRALGVILPETFTTQLLTNRAPSLS